MNANRILLKERTKGKIILRMITEERERRIDRHRGQKRKNKKRGG